MRRTIALTVLTLLLGIVVSAQRKTVTDYYLAFPSDKYATDNAGRPIKEKNALAKHRRALIKIEDIGNGYLRLEGAWEGWAEFALFKKTDGSYLIAHAETECGPACSGSVTFYDYANGNWTDVTSAVFPKLTETEVSEMFRTANIDSQASGTEFYFLLPRVGTRLMISCNVCSSDGSPVRLASFAWNGERFSRIEENR